MRCSGVLRPSYYLSVFMCLAYMGQNVSLLITYPCGGKNTQALERTG